MTYRDDIRAERENKEEREARRNRYIARSLKKKKKEENDEVVLKAAGELFDRMNPTEE